MKNKAKGGRMRYDPDYFKRMYKNGSCSMSQPPHSHTEGKLVNVEQRGNLMVFFSEVQQQAHSRTVIVPYIINIQNWAISEKDSVTVKDEKSKVSLTLTPPI
jgi:hypothetical protein